MNPVVEASLGATVHSSNWPAIVATQAEGGQPGPLDKYLRPKYRMEQPCMPQTALRSTNLCQQLLATQLGWHTPRSLDAWRRVQACSALLQLQLPPVWQSPPSVHQRQEVCCLELQPAPGGGCSSRHSDARLAAVGYSCGMLHIIKLADMLQAMAAAGAAADAEAAAAAAQSSAAEAAAGNQSDPGSTAGHSNEAAQAAAPAAAVPRSVALPDGCVWSVDLQDRLVSCCWAQGDVPELATAGPQGVKIRRFVEGRHQEYPLRVKGGAQLAKPRQVAYLDRGAAYTLAAAHQGGVVLWDCRAASRAVAELPTANTVQLLQPMPGGTVLLAASADGQMALYDVRRLSSSSNSVINFGGSRASQQQIATFNVPARADEAAADGGSGHATAAGSCAVQAVPAAVLGASSRGGGGCGSSLGVSFRIYPFFRDVLLNPADTNLVAYVRPDLQVGLFDLYHNRVLQQVCVTEALGSPDGSSVMVGCQRQAAARCCWDSSGGVLFTHGLLRHCQANSGVAQLQPTLAAVDFGCWAGRQQRWRSSWWDREALGSSSLSSNGLASTQAGGVQQPDPGWVQGALGTAVGFGGSSVWSTRGGGLMSRGGQVLHLPLPHHAAPTELAAGSDGEVFAGTMQGDVMCLH